MYRMLLTDSRIEKLEAPKTGRIRAYDEEIRNLVVTVTSKGFKSYSVIKRRNGKTETHTICKFGEMSLRQVRAAAQTINSQLVLGVDLKAQRKEERESLTLKEFFTTKYKANVQERKRSFSQDEYLYTKYLAPLHNKRLSEISTEDIKNFLKTMREGVVDKGNRANPRGEPTFNKVRNFLHLLYEKAAELVGFDKPNPVKHIKVFKGEPKRRFLSDDEQTRFLKEVEAEGQPFTDFFKLLMFLGCRVGNLRTMEWREIDVESAIWEIPASKFKTKRPHAMPLSGPALEILKRRKSESNGGSYVFPSDTHSSGHIDFTEAAFRRVCKRAKIENFTHHSLRHSFVSFCLKQKLPLVAVSKLVGHSSLKVTADTYGYLEIQHDNINKINEAMAKLANK